MRRELLPLAEQVVLVTGAGGFIGNHIVRLLQRRCKRVRALTGMGDPVREWSSNVETKIVDIRDAAQLRTHSKQVDSVVHLAGPPAVRDSFTSAQLYADVHTGGTANMLQIAHEVGARRFVYISSAEVYGQPLANPVNEQHRLLARSPYAAAKIGAERFVESFAQFSEMGAVVLRPFSIYGPGQTMNSLLGTILRQIENDDVIKLADLRPVRDYCYVTDLAAAVAKACSVEIDSLATLNIGSCVGTSVAEFAYMAAHAVDRDMQITQAELSDRPSTANILKLVSNSQRANEILGWKPEVTLLDGLRMTCQFAGVAK